MVRLLHELCLPPIPWVHQETGQAATEQTYCDRLVQDMPFLTGLGRLSEQQVDRIILQLNRYYPQILSNKDAEKVPRSLRLLSHPFLSGLGEAGGRTAWSSGTPRYLCECVSATSWATCSGAVSGTARSSTGPCTSMPSPCTAACPAGTPCVRPVAFLTCLGLAAGLALLIYCCPPDPKVLPGARRVLGFSPVIVDRHVSRFLLAFLTDDLVGL
ncbi:caspase recruitment domain-containing protein 19 isoform X2 [Physeter macrocephalus]|uniref:Caspase recruitment domain-containing protein 19 isoform X2 n=1 Tax=Physeter macrocephalus TaxID=9755 RepID=A0A9W2WVK9_PHYMC|nr:caspase recruitment domain-containing protein 19 isoform X2 [Physeter catodon]